MSSLTRNQRKRRQLAHLFGQQKGLCFWCKKLMHLGELAQRTSSPHDLCTLDHLDSRLNPMRGKRPPGEVRHVAACWKCNNERANEEHREFQLRKQLAVA